MVGRTSKSVGAHRSQTVRAPGSSIALRSALAADSVSLSASSITTTRQPPTLGAQATRCRSSRTSSTFMESPSVRRISTSAWPPALAVRQSMHVPHPPSGQISAAANAIAALERPLPGGPVKSQACVISWVSSPLRDARTASFSEETMCDWPTSSSNTDIGFT